MPFENREQAAKMLAERLKKYRGRRPLVLGIPRGGVAMAGVMADALDGEVDVVLVHKLGAPGQPEFAIGSIDEGGRVYLAGVVDRLGVPKSYIAEETRHQIENMRKRRAQYTPVRPPISPAGRVVSVVDDGLATGATMVAALHAVRARKPARLIAATAVAPAETVERIGPLADEVVCLEVPAQFFAVGQFFRDFGQVEDEEVIAILRRYGPRGATEEKPDKPT
ncbi:MAG: phosphoribosyltransferase family protein [Verrucomicrobiota bacterium]